jgi:type IV secretion system protein VirB3
MEEDRREMLFLALTRPALLWGAPVEAVALNAGVTLLAGMILSAPVWYRAPFLYWLAAYPIHVVLQRITSWDYHGFRLIRLWLATTGIGRTTLDGLPVRRPRSAGECPASV